MLLREIVAGILTGRGIWSCLHLNWNNKNAAGSSVHSLIALRMRNEQKTFPESHKFQVIDRTEDSRVG
jgi:small neutral amino acid transporter SnatA (MarC family)